MRHRKVRLMLAAENSQTAAGSNSNWVFRKILDSLMIKSVHGVNISKPRTKHGLVLEKAGLHVKRVVQSLPLIPRDNDREISISVEESRLAVAEVFFSGFFPRAGLLCPVCVCVCVCVRAQRQEMANAGAIRDFRSELQMHSVCSLDWLGLDVLEACN